MIPTNEQPYPLPNDWQWVKMKNIATLFTGNSINEKIKTEKYLSKAAGLIYIATKDIGFDNQIDYATNIRIPASDNFKIAPANTPLLCIEGGSAGRKLGFTNQPVCFVNKLCAFVSNKANPKLIYYFLQTQDFAEQFTAMKHGLIGGVSIKNLMAVNFPLPPLNEQQRIVSLLDELFSKLDEVKTLAQTVVDGSEIRRAAILHKAFIGELTKFWRDEHGTTLDSWQEKILKDVVTRIRYGTSEKSDYNKNDFPVLRIPNISDNGIDFSDLKYLLRTPNESCSVHKDDILIVRSNGSRELVGKCALIPELKQKFFYASFLMCITPSQNLYAKFLMRYLNSEDARSQMFMKAKSSVGINNINSKELGAVRLYLPPLNEQKEIVRLLDDLLGREQRTKELALKTLEHIELMKKSILARAFRGELGTNKNLREI